MALTSYDLGGAYEDEKPPPVVLNTDEEPLPLRSPLPLPGPTGDAALPVEARDRAGAAAMELTPSPPEPPMAIGGAMQSPSSPESGYYQTERGGHDPLTEELLAQRPSRSITEGRAPPPPPPPPTAMSPNEELVDRALEVRPGQPGRADPLDPEVTGVRRIKGSPGAPPGAIGAPGELIDHAPRLEPPPARYKSLETNDPKLFGQINHVADSMGIARRDLAAIVFASSGYNPEYRDGPRVGLGGITPQMHRFIDPDSTMNPEDPGDNLFLTAEFYKRMSDFYGPGTAESYAAYRMGDKGKVDAILRRHPDDHQLAAPKGTFDFINRVLGRAGYDTPPETSFGAPTTVPAPTPREAAGQALGAIGAGAPEMPGAMPELRGLGGAAQSAIGAYGAIPPPETPEAMPKLADVTQLLSQAGLTIADVIKNPRQAGDALRAAGANVPQIIDSVSIAVRRMAASAGQGAMAEGSSAATAGGGAESYIKEFVAGLTGEPPDDTYRNVATVPALIPRTPPDDAYRNVATVIPPPLPEVAPAIPAAPAPIQPATSAAPATVAGNAPQPNVLVPGRPPPQPPSAEPVPVVRQGMQPGGALTPAVPVPPSPTTLETGQPPPATTGSESPNQIVARPPAPAEQDYDPNAPLPTTPPTTPITAPPPIGRGGGDRIPSTREDRNVPPASTPSGGPAVGVNAPPSPTSNAPITSLSGHPTNITPEGMVRSAAAGGPNQVLTYLVEHARPGSSVGEAWDQARAATAMYFLAKGDPAGGQHAEAYMFQLQHAGAYQNILAAYRAFGDGDPAKGADLVGAAQALAKSHAFVNDGAMAGLQVIGDKIYFQRFDEQTHRPLGQPTVITADGIRRMVIQAKDPEKAFEMINHERTTNNNIAHNLATETETKRANLAREKETETFHRGTEASRAATLEKDYATISSREQQAAAGRASAEERARLSRMSADERARQSQLRKDAEQSKALAATATKEVENYYGSDAQTEPLDIEGKPMDARSRIKAGDIYHGLRTGTDGKLQPPSAQDMVKSLVLPDNDPRKKFQAGVVPDKDGRQQVVIADAKGNPITYLPPSAVKSWLPISVEPTPSERARGAR